MAVRTRSNRSEGRLLCEGVIGVSSVQNYAGDRHNIIKNHDDHWSQTGKFDEAERSVEKLMGAYSSSSHRAPNLIEDDDHPHSTGMPKARKKNSSRKHSPEQAERSQPTGGKHEQSAHTREAGNGRGQAPSSKSAQHQSSSTNGVNQREHCSKAEACDSNDSRAERLNQKKLLQESGMDAAAAASGISYSSLTEEIVDHHGTNAENSCSDATSGSPQCSAQGTNQSDPMFPQVCEFNPLKPSFPSFQSQSVERQNAARSLHKEIGNFLANHEEEADLSRHFRSRIVEVVRSTVRSCWENSVVDVYGSFSTNLFLPHSDVDLVVVNANLGSNAAHARYALQKLVEKMQAMSWCHEIKTIDKTSVPVIKMEVDLAKLQEADRIASSAAEVQCGLESEVSSVSVEGSELRDQQSDLPEVSVQQSDLPEVAVQQSDLPEVSAGGNGVGAGGSTVGDAPQPSQRLLSVDITLFNSQLKKTLQQQGVPYSPIESRDFIKEQLARFPVIRPLVLVLKRCMFVNSLSDAYKGGLSSHSLILLLIAFFNMIDQLSVPEIGSKGEPDKATAGVCDMTERGDIPDDCVHGEWLIRALQWLSQFPFEAVGMVSGKAGEFVALNSLGQFQLFLYSWTGRFSNLEQTREWVEQHYSKDWDQNPSPFLSGAEEGSSVPGGDAGASRIADEPPGQLYIEESCGRGANVAQSSFLWHESINLLKRALEKLSVHWQPRNPMAIYLGLPEHNAVAEQVLMGEAFGLGRQ